MTYEGPEDNAFRDAIAFLNQAGKPELASRLELVRAKVIHPPEDFEPPAPPEWLRPFEQRKPRPTRRVQAAMRGETRPAVPIHQVLRESNLDGAIKFLDLMRAWPTHANQNAMEAALAWLSCLQSGDSPDTILAHGLDVVRASGGKVTTLRRFLEQRPWDLEAPAKTVTLGAESFKAFH